MTLRDLVGQEAAASALRRSVRDGRVSHAYLFVGPEGVGKRTAALCLAKALNCAQPQEGDACDACDSCRRIELGIHPDVRFVGPTLEDSRGYLTPVADDSPGSAVIRMAQIRVVPDKPRQSPAPLVHDMALRPAAGRWKVYIVSPAERMQAETANALLHVLEEPPGYGVIVLVSARPAALLATIHSRCREVRFGLAPAAAIARHLEGLGVEAARAWHLAGLAGGRTGWAVRASRSPEMMRTREALLNWVERVREAPPEATLRLAEELRTLTYQAWRSEIAGDEPEEDGGESAEADEEGGESGPAAPAQPRRLSEDQVLRARLPQSLEVVMGWLRDLSAAAAGRGDLAVNADRAEGLAEGAARLSLPNLRQAMQAAHRAIGFIERNASIAITTDALTAALQDALTGERRR